MMQLLYIWATYIYRKCLNDFPLSWWYGNRNQIYVNEFVTRFCGIINHMIRRKKEYLYLYNWKVIFLVKSTHHHNPRNRRSFRMCMMMLLAHLYSVLEVMPIKLFNINSYVLCGLFMWPYGIKSILPSFYFCIVLYQVWYLCNAALGFEKVLFSSFTRHIPYLTQIS